MQFPSEFGIYHKGHEGAAVLSQFLFEMVLKIQKTATPEQAKKYTELQEAYRNVIMDLSQVYRLEYLVGQYQMRIEHLIRENTALRAENDKLLKTLEFQQQ